MGLKELLGAPGALAETAEKVAEIAGWARQALEAVLRNQFDTAAQIGEIRQSVAAIEESLRELRQLQPSEESIRWLKLRRTWQKHLQSP